MAATHNELFESPADPVCIAAGLSPEKNWQLNYNYTKRDRYVSSGVLFLGTAFSGIINRFMNFNMAPFSYKNATTENNLLRR